MKWMCSPMAGGAALKMRSVWVRIPPHLPNARIVQQ